VLNLWQKNNVFAPEVIQPLFDLANPDNPLHQQYQNAADNSSANGLNATGISQDSPIQTQQDELTTDIVSFIIRPLFGKIIINSSILFS
jgi:hypothetical protein